LSTTPENTKNLVENNNLPHQPHLTANQSHQTLIQNLNNNNTQQQQNLQNQIGSTSGGGVAVLFRNNSIEGI
jgi:hypothetical protein